MVVPALLFALSTAASSSGEPRLRVAAPDVALRCEVAASDASDASASRRAADRLIVPLASSPDSMLAVLYDSGTSFETFYAAAVARRAMWVRNWTQAVIPADVLAQARAVPAGFRLLAIAIDGCSDSVNTIPYLAKLVAEVPGLSMRIVTPDAGRAVMATHRTPDGRSATPTVILLDAAGNEVGCWIERPNALQARAIEARAAGTMNAFAAGKQQWYDEDAGASTVREVVALLTAAAAGERRLSSICVPG